jgi:hypothetical protein
MAKLLQQHFRPSLAHGYYGHIPSPLFATTIKKFMKTFATQKRTFATQERKRKKGGPSLHVYILGYHVCLT